MIFWYVQASSTLYGPHTLSAYIQEFNKLAKAMAKGEKVISNGHTLPYLSSIQIKFSLETVGDSPPSGKNFGDMKQDIIIPKSGTFRK